MNLFVKPKNKIYNYVADLINCLWHKTEGYMTREEIREFFKKREIIDENIIKALLKENIDVNSNVDLLFKSDDDDYYMLQCEQNIEIKPYLMEKIWLKNILKDPKIKLFLEEKTICKLEEYLSDIDDIMTEENLILKNIATIDSKEIEKLKYNVKIIRKAIKEKRGIKYSYITKYGQVFKERCSLPIKIEYSIKDDLFYLISYPLDQEKPRPIKSLIKSFYDIEIIDENIEYEKKYESFIDDINNKKAKRPITLEISSNNNTLERAFHLFSCFDKKAKYIPDKDIYIIDIYYYQFEEKEIISRIFSLGKEVFVTGPKKIQNEIINRLKTIVNSEY